MAANDAALAETPTANARLTPKEVEATMSPLSITLTENTALREQLADLKVELVEYAGLREKVYISSGNWSRRR